MSKDTRKRLLFVTLIHPDFLPPVLTLAQTLVDHDFDIHILTFDSLVPSAPVTFKGIEIECAGKHHNEPLMKRMALRGKFKQRVKEIVDSGIGGIVAFCPFSFLSAIKFHSRTPVVYFALEISDFRWSDFLRSPLSHLNNLQTLRSLHKCELVATPSLQRSSWLAGRCHTEILPETILNTAYIEDYDPNESRDTFVKLIPPHFTSKKIVLYTGNVNERLSVFEAVKAFDLLQDDDCALILTGIKDNTYCNEIKLFVENSSLRNNILLLPFVTRAEMIALQTHSDIGVCVFREYRHNIASKMIAPNKVGEYLYRNLFLLGVKGAYMDIFEANGVAALAKDSEVGSIKDALVESLIKIKQVETSDKITKFVKKYYCMQVQAAPIINFFVNRTK